MIIIKLQGGLGNQMFQYAFALFLKKHYNSDVYLDKRYFDKAQKEIIDNSGKNKYGVCIRKFELDIFKNLSIPIYSCNHSLKDKIFKSIKPLKKIFFRYFTEKDAFSTDERFYKLKNIIKTKKVFIDGYFQNEGYFKKYANDIKNSFILPPIKSNDTYNQNLLKKIQSCENSVFVHVRREDYVNLGLSISKDYYKKSIAYIKSKISNPHFFVFCAEDPEYIKQNFNFDVDWELVGEKNKGEDVFYENMRLMMACKHAIIANSSYSWWAAWLSDNPNKIVIAPSPWMYDSDSIICDNWKKISSK